MLSPLVISIAAFVGVAALVGAVAFMFRSSAGERAEERLDAIVRQGSPQASKDALLAQSVLAQPLDGVPNYFERIVQRLGSLRLLFEQADTKLKPATFFLISLIMGVSGAFVAAVTGSPLPLIPLAGVILALMPLFWLTWRRKRRLKKFAVQLPQALELIARALRAGHSLAAGFHLVESEMADPIAREFGRVFEEQNLGIPAEEAMEGMTDRVPNLDLKFFVTAVILQRQTGGDLAEILDKIGHLIRERFQVWGQVQALTGEGRLSGVVLLGLPPLLFLAAYRLNPEYVMVLFTDPLGKKMLAAAIFLQVIGAYVIKKIINIRV